MPALTHGRVINGFNSQSRSINFSKRNCDPVNKTCQKDKVCGNSLQPFKMNPSNSLLKRVSSNPSRDKFSSTVSTGRSYAAKRAISRRVSKQTGIYKETNINNIESREYECYSCKLSLPGRALPRNNYNVGGCICCCGLDINSVSFIFRFNIPFSSINNMSILKSSLLLWYNNNISIDVFHLTIKSGSIVCEFLHKNKALKKLITIVENIKTAGPIELDINAFNNGEVYEYAKIASSNSSNVTVPDKVTILPTSIVLESKTSYVNEMNIQNFEGLKNNLNGNFQILKGDKKNLDNFQDAIIRETIKKELEDSGAGSSWDDSAENGVSAKKTAHESTKTENIPILTVEVDELSIIENGANISVKLNQAGEIYYKYLKYSETQPDIKTLESTGSKLTVIQDEENIINLRSLSVNTNYSVYFIAKNTTENYIANIIKVVFKTAAEEPPLLSANLVNSSITDISCSFNVQVNEKSKISILLFESETKYNEVKFEFNTENRSNWRQLLSESRLNEYVLKSDNYKEINTDGGNSETIRFGNLISSTKYYYDIISIDDRGNISNNITGYFYTINLEEPVINVGNITYNKNVAELRFPSPVDKNIKARINITTQRPTNLYYIVKEKTDTTVITEDNLINSSSFVGYVRNKYILNDSEKNYDTNNNNLSTVKYYELVNLNDKTSYIINILAIDKYGNKKRIEYEFETYDFIIPSITTLSTSPTVTSDSATFDFSFDKVSLRGNIVLLIGTFSPPLNEQDNQSNILTQPKKYDCNFKYNSSRVFVDTDSIGSIRFVSNNINQNELKIPDLEACTEYTFIVNYFSDLNIDNAGNYYNSSIFSDVRYIQFKTLNSPTAEYLIKKRTEASDTIYDFYLIINDCDDEYHGTDGKYYINNLAFKLTGIPPAEGGSAIEYSSSTLSVSDISVNIATEGIDSAPYTCGYSLSDPNRLTLTANTADRIGYDKETEILLFSITETNDIKFGGIEPFGITKHISFVENTSSISSSTGSITEVDQVKKYEL